MGKPATWTYPRELKLNPRGKPTGCYICGEPVDAWQKNGLGACELHEAALNRALDKKDAWHWTHKYSDV